MDYSHGRDIYNLYRYTGLITSINDSLTLVGSTRSTSIIDNGLMNGTYYYVITAVNATGRSIVSNCLSVRVTIPPSTLTLSPSSNLENNLQNFNGAVVIITCGGICRNHNHLRDPTFPQVYNTQERKFSLIFFNYLLSIKRKKRCHFMNRMNNEKKQFGSSVQLIPKRITALTVLALLCIINASHVPVVFTVSQINIRNSPLTANTAPGIIITGANWTNCGWVNGSGTLADPCASENLVDYKPDYGGLYFDFE